MFTVISWIIKSIHSLKIKSNKPVRNKINIYIFFSWETFKNKSKSKNKITFYTNVILICIDRFGVLKKPPNWCRILSNCIIWPIVVLALCTVGHSNQEKHILEYGSGNRSVLRYLTCFLKQISLLICQLSTLFVTNAHQHFHEKVIFTINAL